MTVETNKGKAKWTVVLGLPNLDHPYWKDREPTLDDLIECWAPTLKAPQKCFDTKKEAEKEVEKLLDSGYDKYKVRAQKYNPHKVKP